MQIVNDAVINTKQEYLIMFKPYVALFVVIFLLFLFYVFISILLNHRNDKLNKKIEVLDTMEELKTRLIGQLQGYSVAYIEAKNEALETGEFKDDELLRVHSQVTQAINLLVNEAKVRIGYDKPKKKWWWWFR